jgi:hypothetical protein
MEPTSGMLLDAADELARHFAVGGVLILVLVIGGSVVVPWLRRRFHPSGRARQGAGGAGFTMDRLEAMRRGGEISEEEFRVLRRSALGLDRGAGKTQDSASSRPTGRDDDEGTVGADGSCADRDDQEERR